MSNTTTQAPQLSILGELDKLLNEKQQLDQELISNAISLDEYQDKVESIEKQISELNDKYAQRAKEIIT